MQEPKKCLVAEAMEILGRKWAIIILFQLLSGPKRFCQLEVNTDASSRLLSERLKDLEVAGMVTRTIYPEVPPRVEYALTEKGKEIEPVIRHIYGWASKWLG